MWAKWVKNRDQMTFCDLTAVQVGQAVFLFHISVSLSLPLCHSVKEFLKEPVSPVMRMRISIPKLLLKWNVTFLPMR